MKFSPFVFFSISVALAALLNGQGYYEKEGLVSIEAEDYASQTKADVRRWFRFDATTPDHSYWDSDDKHLEGASGGAYLEILPDTRTHHGEKLIHGENFTNTPGEMAILSYPVYFETPGRYYVWARAFSTGPEDNGMHIGLNGEWPESGQRLQLCKGKHQWTWSSQQRVPENHCGVPFTLWLDVEEAGQQTVMVSMREDGVELDKLILSLDPGYTPEGQGPKASKYAPGPLAEKDSFFDISSYRYILRATEDFEVDAQARVPYYLHKGKSALAINAAEVSYRKGFARATTEIEVSKPTTFDLQLVTLSETDGESRYRVYLNDKLIGDFTNPETSEDYKEAYFRIESVELKKGDVIAVESNAVTNGKIPEGDGTAFARGRWIGLVLQ